MEKDTKTFERIYYAVSEDTARQAKRMNSFYDYKAGSATADYRAMADEAYDLAEEKINGGLTPDNAETVWYLATKYARKMAEYLNAQNSNDTKCPSIMISGAGNFPVRKKEKQNAKRASLMNDYEYIQGLLVRIRNIAYSNAIKSSDPNAIELLEAKLERLEDAQAEMKHANAYHRKHKTMKGYVTLDGQAYSESQAEAEDERIKNSYSWAQKPYASFSLSNNNQNIASVKGRIEQIKKNKEIAAAGGMQYDTGDICEVVEDEADMRIRLLFPDKPDEDTRKILKSNGFVWSPKAGAWQRQLNNNGRRAVRWVLEALKKREQGGGE